MKSNRFNTDRFGLNERETLLLISALNGVGLFESQVPSAEWLSRNILDAGVEANADLEEMGVELSLKETSPELPYEYCDLCEKTKALKDWEAAALYFYVCGFSAGRAWDKKQAKAT